MTFGVLDRSKKNSEPSSVVNFPLTSVRTDFLSGTFLSDITTLICSVCFPLRKEANHPLGDQQQQKRTLRLTDFVEQLLIYLALLDS